MIDAIELSDRIMRIVTLYDTTPFKYGSYDCATFFGECYKEVSPRSVNPLTKFCGKYSSAIEAYKLVKKHKSNSMESYCLKFLEPIPLLLAETGSFVMHDPAESGISCEAKIVSPLIIVNNVAYGYDERGIVTLRPNCYKRTYRVKVRGECLL
jgi:hypothetical protein